MCEDLLNCGIARAAWIPGRWLVERDAASCACGLGVALQTGRQTGGCAEVRATWVSFLAGALWSLLILETDRLEGGLARAVMRHGKRRE